MPPVVSAAPFPKHAKALRALLEEATTRRLPAGESVGVLLSGGIDSSLVTALAAKLHDHAVRTYSISFGTDLPNELAYSGLVASEQMIDMVEHGRLTITADALHLPEHLEASIEGLEAGSRVTAGEVPLPDGVELAADSEQILAVVAMAPTAEQLEGEVAEAEEAVEGEEGAEGAPAAEGAAAPAEAAA